MSYTKPKLLAENQPERSYSAGCPEREGGWCSIRCEIRQ